MKKEGGHDTERRTENEEKERNISPRPNSSDSDEFDARTRKPEDATVTGTQPSFFSSLIAVVCSAVLMILSFPPLGWWVLGWIAPAPLMWSVGKVKRRVTAFLAGWLVGTLFYYGSCWWISHSMIHYGEIPTVVAHLFTLVIAAILGLFTGLFALAAHQAERMRPALGLAVAPFFWVASEYLRINLAGMGWNALGYSQAFHPELIQSARFWGVYGIGFLMTVVSSSCLYALGGRRRAVAAAAGVACLLAVVVIDGRLAVNSVETIRRTLPQAEFVAVQPCAPILIESSDEFTAAFDRQLALSRTSAKRSVTASRLIVWPESQLGVLLDDPEGEELKAVGALAVERDAFVLFNALRRTRDGRFYNIAALVGPDGRVRGEYRKVHLLPFGEYIPFRSLFERLGFLPLAIDAEPSVEPVVLEFGRETLGASICFESTFPTLTNEFRRRGACLLVNIANDGWFGPTAGTEQHLGHLVFRAVETRLDTVRVTNTGVGAFLSASGRIEERTPMFEPTVSIRAMRLFPNSPPPTLYAAWGDWFARGCLVVSVILFIGMVYIDFNRHRAGSAPNAEPAPEKPT